MSKMIAYCGLVCTDCPTFLATQNDNDNARRETAAYYAEQFGLDFKPEDINCDGCLSVGGKLIAYCQTCEIRQCCGEKGLDNCALCDDESCEKLEKFYEFSPIAKEYFEALKKEIKS